MKKIYLLILALFFTLAQYGQNMVAIDRLNGPGPTAVGTVPNISSVGLTRGSDLTQTEVGGNFSSFNWSTSTIDLNKYIQWSVSSNAGFETILTLINVSLQRDIIGPMNLELRYSLDGFSSFTPITAITLSDTSQLNLTIPLSGVTALSGQTVTFRLYGYAAGNVNGTLEVAINPGGPILGITDPGIKIRGSVTPSDLIYSNNVWTPSAPNANTFDNDAFILNGTYTINSEISLNNLNVSSEGNVVIPANILAIVNSSLFESTSINYPSLIVDGTLTGIIQYDRHVNINNGTGSTTGNNDLISAPLSGQSFGAFATANPNIVSDPANPARKLFGPFDKATGTYVIYNATIDAGVPLVAGLGYRAASSDSGGFLFTGSVNNGTVNQSIINAGPQFKEWNLIGNPYPSYINLASFLAPNNSQFDPSASGVYGYDGQASDGYTIWNQAYAEANPNAAITPGQGFLVAAPTGGGTVSFTPEMRVTGNTDDFIPGRSSGNISFLKLHATNGTKNYFTEFYLNDNASLGLDPGYDAAVFGYNAPSFAIYSHLVQNSSGKDMALQSIGNADLTNEVIIPLGINVAQGQQVTVSISESTLSPDTKVYLEDNVAGTFTLLTTGDYTFTANTTLNDTGRFFLRFSQSTLSLPETLERSLQIYATSSPRALFVKGQLEATTTVKVYDTLGRQVLTSNLDAGSSSNNVDVSSLSAGVYVVKLNNALQQKTQKVILK